MDLLLTIAQVVARTGLSADTLRYYERIGLLAPVARATGGQRRYRAADLDWLAFVQRLRATGMPIRDMLHFAALRSQGDATAAARRELLQAHLAGVQAHIRMLQQSAQALQAKIAHYDTLVDAQAGAPASGGVATSAPLTGDSHAKDTHRRSRRTR